MKKRKKRLVLGFGMVLVGAGLLFFGSLRSVTIVQDGAISRVLTRSRNTAAILAEAGVEVRPKDLVIPALNKNLGSHSGIRVDHGAQVHLNLSSQSEPFQYDTRQHIAGNMLLDINIRLYPGDQLFWKDTPIQPDFSFAGVSAREVTLKRAAAFQLWTDGSAEPLSVHGSGNTVLDALISIGVRPDRDMLIVPNPEEPFTEGMSIAALRWRDLQIASNGGIREARSAGATVGEALARVGLPLSGNDVSIPAAGEPLPEDGRILIVPVREAFRTQAKADPAGNEWIANDSLPLDKIELLKEGQDGMTGTFQRIRYESNEEVLNETSDEKVLSEPKKAVYAYGTKAEVKTLDTPEGPLEYWRAVPVYATSYSPCHSGTGTCVNGTASGAKVDKGIIAVTSSWYTQMAGMQVYIPNYGKAVIGDTGGGIPGKNWIDLAYNDAEYIVWGQDTTLYFLTPIPAEIPWIVP